MSDDQNGIEQRSLLRGRYALERLIDDEPLARTYIARDLVLDRILAASVLQPYVATRAHLVERFLEAERRAGALFHPNLVTVFDVGASDGLCWSAHEYCGGGTLRQRLPSRQPIPAWQVMSLLGQIGSALATLHRLGLVHGRLTPDCIRFDDAGTVKLGGIGIAAMAELPDLPTAVVESDARAHLAPEQHKQAPSSPAADQFALALMGAELLGGSWHTAVPDGNDRAADDLVGHLRQLRSDLSSSALTALSRALSNDPDRRFGSVDDFLLAFSGGAVEVSRSSLGTLPAAENRSLLSDPETAAHTQDYEARPAAPIDIAPTRRWSKPSGKVLVDRSARMASRAGSRTADLAQRGLMSSSIAVSNLNSARRDLSVRAANYRAIPQRRVGEWYQRKHPVERLLMIAGVVTLVLAVGLIVPLMLNPPPSYAAPSLEGVPADAARNVAEQVGLRVALRNESSHTVPAGQVIRQETPAGTLVRSDRPISLVVSSGPPPVSMPNIVRRDLESARQELESVGLKLGSVSEYDTNRQPWGTIAAQNVRSGRSLPLGSSVDVTIATPPWTEVPRLLDRGIGDVERELDGRGLKLGEVKLQEQEAVRAGTVLLQEPSPDTRIRQGNRVAVVISVPGLNGRTTE